MTKHRIISMDGGMSGYITAELLRRSHLMLEDRHKSLLRATDVFAGTSAGALNALFFAANEHPERATEDLLQFWERVVADSVTMNPARVITGLVGARALGSREKLTKFLIDYFGEHTTLGDLKRKVVCPAFELHRVDQDSGRWAWHPRLFHNIPGAKDYSPEERVVDVALRSSNVPIVTPIFAGIHGGKSGYIDGGLVANNPSLCALSVLFEIDRADDNQVDLSEISVLSLGCGQEPFSIDPEMVNGEADWGYGQWLLNPQEPLLLLRLAMRGGTGMINYQCAQLLGKNFCRVDPELKSSPHPFDIGKAHDVIMHAIELAEFDDAVEQVCQWFDPEGRYHKTAKRKKSK